MPVGVGPYQPGSDLGAVDRTAVDLEISPQHGEIETRIVEQLQPPAVREQPPQVGRRVVARRELDQMGRAVARRQLHQAQAIATRLQPHGLGIDRHGVAEIEPGRQIATMQGDVHVAPVVHDEA